MHAFELGIALLQKDRGGATIAVYRISCISKRFTIIGGTALDIEYMLCMLEDKDTSAAYAALKELETLSDTSDALYTHTDKFVSMIASDKYVIRVRGFRLFCKQAKWDKDNIIDRSLDSALNILNDEKPTAVRQALFALQEVAVYKKSLCGQIRQRVLEINYLRYKDTMHSLIAKDIESLLKVIDGC